MGLVKLYLVACELNYGIDTYCVVPSENFWDALTAPSVRVAFCGAQIWSKSRRCRRAVCCGQKVCTKCDGRSRFKNGFRENPLFLTWNLLYAGYICIAVTAWQETKRV